MNRHQDATKILGDKTTRHIIQSETLRFRPAPAQQTMQNRSLVLTLLSILSLISSTEPFSIEINYSNMFISNTGAFVASASPRATPIFLKRITMNKPQMSDARHRLSKAFCRRELFTKCGGLGIASLSLKSPWTPTKCADGDTYEIVIPFMSLSKRSFWRYTPTNAIPYCSTYPEPPKRWTRRLCARWAAPVSAHPPSGLTGARVHAHVQRAC